LFKVEQNIEDRSDIFIFGYAIWSTVILLFMTHSIALLLLNNIIIISLYFIIRFNKEKLLKIALITLFILAVPWIVKTIFAFWNQLQAKLVNLYGFKMINLEFANMNIFVVLLLLVTLHYIILRKQSKIIMKWLMLFTTLAFVIFQLDSWYLLLISYFAIFLMLKGAESFWRRFSIPMIGLAILTVLGLCLILPNKDNLQKIPQYFQNELELKYAGDQENTWMRNGVISEVGTRTKLKDTALEVVMEKPQAMYFKGFIGKEFTGDSWKTQSFEEAAAHNDLFYWLNEENFSSNTMLASLQFKAGQTNRSTLVISTDQADQRYRYIPYGVVTDLESKHIQQDGFEKYPTEFNQKYSVENNVLENYAKNASKIDPQKMKKYLTLESNYRKFVQEEYLTVSHSDQLILQQDFKKQSKIDYEKSIQFVQDLVAKNIRYDEKAKRTNEVISTVWQTERRGYSPHYATVGTLAFRMMGIPARYVEGYIITNDQIEGKNAFSKIEVPLSSAHAWTEIYIDQVGWVPIELVPKIRKEMPQVKASYIPKGNHVSKNPTANGSASNEGSNELTQKEIQDHENQTPPQPKRENVEKKWYVIVSIVLFVLFILIVVSIIFIRRRKIRKLYKQLKSNSIVEHLQASIHISEIWLNARLPEYEENVTLTNKLSQMNNKLSNEAIEQFENTYTSYQAAKYGGEEVSRSELVPIMKKELIKPLKWWQKLKYKWFLMKY